MHLADVYTRIRLGWPRRGKIEVHTPPFYTFEDGAETPGRLARAFGDPRRLSAADLGAGPCETPIARDILAMPWKRLVSVEAFPPYLMKLHERKSAAARHEIYGGKIQNALAEFKPGEIDVALLIDVLEHFPRREALDLLARIEKTFRLGAAIFLPIGPLPQEPYDGNELQRHRSAWDAADLARLGYDVAVYEKFHGYLNPPWPAAWAIKAWGRA